MCLKAFAVVIIILVFRNWHLPSLAKGALKSLISFAQTKDVNSVSLIAGCQKKIRNFFTLHMACILSKTSPTFKFRNLKRSRNNFFNSCIGFLLNTILFASGWVEIKADLRTGETFVVPQEM